MDNVIKQIMAPNAKEINKQNVCIPELTVLFYNSLKFYENRKIEQKKEIIYDKIKKKTKERVFRYKN